MTDYKTKFMEDNFFNPEVVRKPLGYDLFGNQMLEGDEVFIYNDSYLLIEKMKKTQIEMAKLMKLERGVL